MIPAPFKVVLDACVLYPLTVRDVLLQAAADGFYQAYWSEVMLDEASRNLVADGRTSEERAARLVATMRCAFPEAQITDYESLIPSMRNDEKDRHVVAAAVKAGAQVIVTSNTKDFYGLPSGIEIQTPDEFLSNLFDLDRPRMMVVLESSPSGIRSPRWRFSASSTRSHSQSSETSCALISRRSDLGRITWFRMPLRSGTPLIITRRRLRMAARITSSRWISTVPGSGGQSSSVAM